MADEMRKALIDTIIGADISLVGTDGKSYAEVYADALLEAGWKKYTLNVGDTVYMEGIPFKVSFIHIANDITYVIEFDCCDFAVDCSDCPFYEDEISFEGEHDCRTQGYLEFKEEDIGKTVFLSLEDDNRFHGDGEHDGKVITCPECETQLLIEFGRASCFHCKWSASDADLDEIMTEDSDE